VEFRVLGALELVDGGQAVPLGGRRQRSLLAILLLRANKVVTSDSLIDELWGERPPPTAQHTLHAYVSRLRKLLREHGGSEQMLVSYPDGYLLRVEFGQFDLNRFEHLAEEARRALDTGAFQQAAATCRAALALWRGPALADLRFEPFARVDVERLEEQRVGVVEDRIAADLNLGRHAVLVAELEALIAEHPLRERLREQLMLALYRSGRRAEALEAYRSARTYLVEECGLEPGKPLQSIHRRILDGDRRLDLAGSGRASVMTTVGADDATPREPRQATREPGQAPREPRQAPHDGPNGAAPSPANHPAPRAPAGKRRIGWMTRRRWEVAGIGGLAAAVAASALLTIDAGSDRTLAASAVHPNSVVFVDPAHPRLLGQVDTGGRPAEIATGFGRVWVSDSANGRVLVLDPSTFRIEDQIPVGRAPTGLVAGGNGMWVIDPGSGNVFEIASGSHTVVATVTVGTRLSAIAAGAGAVWIADASSGVLTRVDPDTASVADTIVVGQPLTDVTVGLGAVWVTSASSGQLIEIDPHTGQVTQAVAIGNGPAAVRVVGGAVWVANPPDDALSRFDPGTGVVRKVSVPTPTALAVAAGRLWVADGVKSALTRIDPTTDKSTRVAALANPPSAMVGAGGSLAMITGVSPTEHRGGTLRAVAGEGVDSIDPGESWSITGWELLSMTHDGLLTYTRASRGGTSALVPDLATSLPVVDDARRTFTFKLRDGVRYSDGTLVRPVDFRRALEREYGAGTGLSAVGVPLAGAEHCGPSRARCDLRNGVTVDDAAGTITYHLSAPDPAFLYQLALPFGAAVPANAPDIGPRTGPLPGTGPYVIASYTPNHTVRLVRNPHFRSWSTAAQPDGFPAQISVQLGLDPAAQAAAVAAGRADVMLDTPPAHELDGLRRDVPQQMHTYSLAETQAMFLNTRIAPFDRPAVRRAVALAVDRTRLVELAGGPELARPTCQILPLEFPGYYPYCPSTINPGPAGVWHGAALPQARALIAASGTSGATVTVSTIASDPFKLATGRYFVGLLDALGYHARLRTYPDDHSYYDQVGSGKARSQIGVFGWMADYQAGSSFFGEIFTCAAYRPNASPNLNPGGFCDRHIDTQIAHATLLQTVNVAAANRAWQQIDAEVTRDAPWIPLVNPLGIDLVSARVGNYQRSPAFGVLLDQLWVR
jgi:ABC-type transport system substrate-binding protein/DNA-binding SARP family transcriptional activator/streptogramin lyase